MPITAYDPHGNPLSTDPLAGPSVFISAGHSGTLADYQLSDVVNDTPSRLFCGPTVVASITRRTGSEVLEAFRVVRHGRDWKKKLKGTPDIIATTCDEISRVLQHFGFSGCWETVEDSPTLAKYIREMPWWEARDPLIILVTGHVVAVNKTQFCDTISRHKVVDIAKAPGRRKRVIRVLRLTDFRAPELLLGYLSTGPKLDKPSLTKIYYKLSEFGLEAPRSGFACPCKDPIAAIKKLRRKRHTQMGAPVSGLDNPDASNHIRSPAI